MTRLMMGFGSPLLSCFVIVAAVTFAESLVVSKEDESLMWPSTPIWLAKYNETNDAVTYTRIYGLNTMLEGLSTSKGWNVTRDLHERHEVDPQDSVMYPSVLLVMDYNNDRNRAFGGTGKPHPGQLLMYALAFWNSVGKALDFKDPKVVIQIGGLIITDSRSASPYMNRNTDRFTIASALPPMIKYWSKKSTKDNLISGSHPTTFDIVVHMTDLMPYDELA